MDFAEDEDIIAEGDKPRESETEVLDLSGAASSMASEVFNSWHSLDSVSPITLPWESGL